VERASHRNERIMPLLETNDVDAPYFSLVLVPGVQVATR
jgi:precorrin-2 methylase